VRKQIKQLGIAALIAFVVIMASCKLEMLGMEEKPDPNFKPIGYGLPGGQLGDLEEEIGIPSSNANIRAVTGEGATALYGLYIGGMPGIDNGTPQATADDEFTDATITISGNNPTANPERNVVVIVEDTKVSKVEFGINAGNTVTSGSTPTLTDESVPSTWYALTKNNDFATPDTINKRWVGPLTVTAPTSSSCRAVYVRITAQDGTEQVYRYVQYISTTVTTSVTRGELTALSIGGVAVISTTGSGSSATSSVQSPHSKGIAAGWWNKTVAPDFTPGEVTITAAQAANCAVTAKINNSASGVNVSIAKISASQWPLLENSVLTFEPASSDTNGSATFTNVANGDYIVIRQNASPSDTSYKGLFSHYIIKVNVVVPNTLSITYSGGGGSGSSPTSPSFAYNGENVLMPANTYTREGYTFAGWEVSGEGSTAGTYQAGASVAVSALSTAIATGNASITLTATWSDAPVAPLSNNANIRAVTGTGANALYGLYIGGMPGLANGDSRTTDTGFTGTNIALSANLTIANPANNRSIVVIVQDENVSKVEFGINNTNTTTPPSTYKQLTKNDDYSAPDIEGKRWTGTLTEANLTGSGTRGVYVKITAQDGTVQYYRYIQYVSTSTASSGAALRGEIATLTIGGKEIVKSAAVQSGCTIGTFAGWWNRTVAPEFTPGEVTLTSAQAANGAISATFTHSGASGAAVSYAKISASDWPLKENSVVNFTQIGTNLTGSGTISGITDGDYIIIRMNAATTANYEGLFSHYIIKVNVQD